MSSSEGVFPLSALVGVDTLRLALVLCAVDPGIGGVLVRGEKGSGKTTAARGLAEVLPGDAPFVELPLGATEDRVVGALDLRAALGDGQYRFQPGLLAAAHNGVLYVDEVNLLADHLVDVLLDAAASGTNRVERDGVSHAHPSRFVLVGSMNPEEGELRPQLLDRFGVSVEVRAPADPAVRAVALRRRIAFDRDPEAFADTWRQDVDALRKRLATTRPAPLAPGIEDKVAEVCAAAGAEGLRADLVICRAAGALAGWEGRAEAGEDEVRRVAPLALAHRRATPWQAEPLARPPLEDVLDRAFEGGAGASLRGAASAGDGAHRRGHDEGAEPDVSPAAGPTGMSSPATTSEGPTGMDPPPATGPSGADASATTSEGPTEQGSTRGGADPGAPWPGAVPRGLLDPAQRVRRSGDGAAGRRSGALGAGERGRVVGARVPEAGTAGAVAAAATVTAAVGRQVAAGELVPGVGVRPEEGDLREAVHRTRLANLVVLAVDTSGSMGVDERVEAARGAVGSLLVDAYQRRDRVAVVTFRGKGAEVVLRPTGSSEVAVRRLATLPRGGRTPLSAGIREALRLATSPSAAACRPLIVLVSDGRATWADGGEDPMAAARRAAGDVRRAGVDSLVVDCEQGGVPLGLAERLAEDFGGRLVRWEALVGRRPRADDAVPAPSSAGSGPGRALADLVRRTLGAG